MLRIFTALVIVFLSQVSGAADRSWIVFRDKGPGTLGMQVLPQALRAAALGTLTPRAIHRRSKSLNPVEVIDAQDLPVYQPYLDSLQRLGMKPTNVLRWFNAVTATITDSQFSALQQMSCVQAVAPVRSLLIPARERMLKYSDGGASFAKSADAAIVKDSLDFAGTYDQLHLSGLDSLQSLGITGNGVLLGQMDNGFRWRIHDAMRDSKVVGEYDFVMHDSVTSNQVGDVADQDLHGTLTFSTICGWEPGTLIGGAFNAEYLLAKTEDNRSETHVEEDNYAAALEWMEAQGVDVTTSSLGYFTFDSGQTSYTYGDMNGRTSICARAVERAVKLGVCCVTAAGNSGGDSASPHIISPGDADTMITCGAVDTSGIIAAFSSRGPTSDGRIKPDVCAMGVQTLGANAGVPDGFFRANGTSLATPLMASCAVLLLSAHPEMTNVQVRDALRASGDHAVNPDTAYGWGVANVYHAALKQGVVISNPPRLTLDSITGHLRIVCAVAAEEGINDDSVFIALNWGRDTSYAPMTRICSSDLFTAVYPDLSMTDVRPWSDFLVAHSKKGRVKSVPISQAGINDSRDTTDFRTAPIGYGAPCNGIPGSYTYSPFSDTLQTYPNPYTSSSTVRIGLSGTHRVSLDVYNILGQNCGHLYDGFGKGWYEVQWDKPNLGAGTYFLWLHGSGESKFLQVLKVNNSN